MQNKEFLAISKAVLIHCFNSLALSDDQKVQEIVYSLDEDNDGAADPWELHDWIVWVEKIVHRHVLNEQWEDLGGGNNRSARNLSWGDYQVNLKSNLQDTGYDLTLIFLLLMEVVPDDITLRTVSCICINRKALKPNSISLRIEGHYKSTRTARQT